MSDQNLQALIAQWQQAANNATTGDAAATYLECANALAVAIAVQILVAVCECCGTKIQMPTNHARKVYPDLPAGWSQLGKSKHGLKGHGVRLAAWCPACRTARPPV